MIKVEGNSACTIINDKTLVVKYKITINTRIVILEEEERYVYTLYMLHERATRYSRGRLSHGSAVNYFCFVMFVFMNVRNCA